MTRTEHKEPRKTVITPGQLRAARAMLSLTRKELRAVSGISVETIKNIESGKFEPQAATVGKIVQCFSDRGVEFIGRRGILFVLSDESQS